MTKEITMSEFLKEVFTLVAGLATLAASTSLVYFIITSL